MFYYSSDEENAGKTQSLDIDMPDAILKQFLVPTNKHILKIIGIIKPYLRQLIDDSNTVSAKIGMSFDVYNYNLFLFSYTCGYPYQFRKLKMVTILGLAFKKKLWVKYVMFKKMLLKVLEKFLTILCIVQN